jgi:GNAT superfamily N-acetyltransferase
MEPGDAGFPFPDLWYTQAAEPQRKMTEGVQDECRFAARKGDMIRRCTADEFEMIYEIVNDAARAYRGVIPEDRWREPYMPREELRHEIGEGVLFWGCEEEDLLVGVMGLQEVRDVTLIRHAYVRTARRNRGIGGRLLSHLKTRTDRPLLVGTWGAAGWAVRFYEERGFRLVSPEEKNRLLKKYWSIPDRQVETSLVLGDRAWFDSQGKDLPQGIRASEKK